MSQAAGRRSDQRGKHHGGANADSGSPMPNALSERIVACPSCQGDSVYAPANPYRPFCSRRCKGNDLGAWANEDFRVAAAPDPSEDDPAVADPE